MWAPSRHLLITMVAMVASSSACVHQIFKPPPVDTNAMPAILSSLYGYDDCIGGVNNFSTEEEYLEDLKRRNCTVVMGPGGKEITNVAQATSLKFACGQPFGTFEWLDGIPVVFNYPLVTAPDKTAIEVELSDGSVTSPVCVITGPANEENEMDTLLILGQFGNGPEGSVWPVRISTIGQVSLAGPDGELDAMGLSYSSPLDMEYGSSSVRMVFVRMWDVKDYDEGSRYPGWPLPSSSYPNNCQSLFPSTTHVARVAFSGGITRNGVSSVEPPQTNIFTLRTASSLDEVGYLGLADLGKTTSASPGEEYVQDGDNYLDICMDLTYQPAVLQEDLLLSLYCDLEQGSALYPPKGEPYICKPAEVIVTSEGSWGHFIKTWMTEH